MNISPNSKANKSGFAAFGQGTIEYALILIFTGIGLVLVTGAAYTGLSNRTADVICNIGNEGREEQQCEEVETPPTEVAVSPEDPDDPDRTFPPIANFVCTCSGPDCLFDAGTSFDQDQEGFEIVSYQWDFGTGSGPQPAVEEATAAFTYAAERAYIVTLTVTDNEGETDTYEDACTVGTPPECPPFPDFDALPPGTELSTQFEGMTISSVPSNPSADPVAWQTNHPIWTFDSGNPMHGQTNTNLGDPDLGTPNEAFGGPGVGHEGGVLTLEDGSPNPYLNDVPLGNLLIIQESTAAGRTPDDNGRGGVMRFEFDQPALVDTIRFVDVDEGRAATVRVFGVDGELLTGADSPDDAGENSVVPFTLNQRGVARLEIFFPGSGAIDSVFFCDQFDGETA